MTDWIKSLNSVKIKITESQIQRKISETFCENLCNIENYIATDHPPIQEKTETFFSEYVHFYSESINKTQTPMRQAS